MIDPKTQESIDWLNQSHQRTVSNAITDDVMVRLFYAAHGDITQFRIKGRKIIEEAGATIPFDSPAHVESERITPEMVLIHNQLMQFRKDACIHGSDRVDGAFIKSARVLMGARQVADAQDAERYRWLSKRVVITDGSTPGLMVFTAVDDGTEYGNKFLDEFTGPAINASALMR